MPVLNVIQFLFSTKTENSMKNQSSTVIKGRTITESTSWDTNVSPHRLNCLDWTIDIYFDLSFIGIDELT